MPNVPEDMRRTVKVQLRLQHEVAAKLDKDRGKKGRSEWVSELIKAVRKLGYRRGR